MTLTALPPHKRVRGFSLIELLVVVGLFGILMGVAIPQLPNGAYSAWTAQEQLLADLRLTRADALTKGDHFRLRVTGTTAYAEYRMTLAGGVWSENATPVRSRTLQNGVTFPSGAVGKVFEFDTRGLMLNPSAATTITLTDAHTGHTRNVSVYPSGQVVPQ